MNNETKSLNSELYSNCYDDSTLAWIVRYILNNFDMFGGGESELETAIESVFNESDFSRISELESRKILSKSKSFSRGYYLNTEDYLDIVEKFPKNNINKHFDIDYIEIVKHNTIDYVNIKGRTISLYELLSEVSSNEFPVCSFETFKSLIRCFYELSAECVFHPGNANLNNLLFRKSMTLETLYCIGKIPFKNDEKKKKGYAYYNVNSPYVAESFLRTVDNMKKIIISDKNSLSYFPVLKALRTEIFINKMIRSFTRSTSYNQFTNYRVSLNRHNTELISIPYNELSSIEEVKPLRLFEKIISHIHLYKKEQEENKAMFLDKPLLVNIAVIGHTEVSFGNQNNDNGKYTELFDLLCMIVDWYARIETKNESDARKLDLTITYFVNNGDVLNVRHFDDVDNDDKESDNKGEYKKFGHLGVFNVIKCSYYREFNFSKKMLKEIIHEYSLVFVLDCPWMTSESYELTKDGGLSSYCSFLEKRNTIDVTKFGNLDSDRSTDMQYLDVQYNRITSSDSVSSGLISRVFRDDYLRVIVDYLKHGVFSNDQQNNTRRDVYVFTSEKEGVDYSYLGSYPLLRKEMYGDKIFSIAHFTNRKSENLHLVSNGEKLVFYIRLWSILKYIAISYVSVYLRGKIDEMLLGYTLSAEDYFELLRSIVVKLELSSDLNKVSIFFEFDEKIINLLQSEYMTKEKLKGFKAKIHQFLSPFVKALYEEIVFSDKDGFGYETIRTAFEMNLYSSAANVESMLFIHFYSQKRSEKCIKDFLVESNLDEYYSFDEDELDNDFRHFKDKRLYQMLFQILEQSHRFNIGTRAALHKAKEIYGSSNIEKVLLENIVAVCQKTNKTNTNIYKKALYALSEL